MSMILMFFASFLFVAWRRPKSLGRRWAALVLGTVIVLGYQVLRLYLSPVTLGD